MDIRSDIQKRIAGAFAGPREAVRENYEDARESLKIIRESAPTLTTALLIVVLVIGGFAGWWLSAWRTRVAVNAEWRAKIAAASAPVRKIIADGNSELSATDDEIIEALGETDVRLSSAESALKNLPATGGECRINADSLRVK